MNVIRSRTALEDNLESLVETKRGGSSFIEVNQMELAAPVLGFLSCLFISGVTAQTSDSCSSWLP